MSACGSPGLALKHRSGGEHAPKGDLGVGVSQHRTQQRHHGTTARVTVCPPAPRGVLLTLLVLFIFLYGLSILCPMAWICPETVMVVLRGVW